MYYVSFPSVTFRRWQRLTLRKVISGRAPMDRTLPNYFIVSGEVLFALKDMHVTACAGAKVRQDMGSVTWPAMQGLR
jgi:hypothetical protein